MRNKKKEIRLYDVLFPIWGVFLYLSVCLAVLVGSLAVVSFVMLIGMRILKITDKKRFFVRHVLRVYAVSVFSYVIGILYMVAVSAFTYIFNGPILTVPAFIISAALILVINYFITFRGLERKSRLTLSILLTIFTSPYMFLFPPELWFSYGFVY